MKKMKQDFIKVLPIYKIWIFYYEREYFLVLLT